MLRSRKAADGTQVTRRTRAATDSQPCPLIHRRFLQLLYMPFSTDSLQRMLVEMGAA
jgi:hypothetical protein